MRSSWIPYDKNLIHKREVFIIAHLTGFSIHDVVGRLMPFWAWADDQTADGYLAGLTIPMLAARKPELSEALLDALDRVEWIQEEAHGVRIVNFDAWMGRRARDRLLATRRQQHRRGNRSNDSPSVTQGA